MLLIASHESDSAANDDLKFISSAKRRSAGHVAAIRHFCAKLDHWTASSHWYLPKPQVRGIPLSGDLVAREGVTSDCRISL